MPFLHLADTYNDHPKFAALSDGAFRLWHQAMGFCRTYETDGLIPKRSIVGFRAWTPKRATELQTPWQAGAFPLWELQPNGDVLVHDYLDWNRSKADEAERRAEAKERMRSRRVRSEQRENKHITELRSSHEVLREEKRSIKYVDPEKKEDARARDQRAGALLNRYAELFQQHRKGAKYHNRMHLDFDEALALVTTWPDDERLYKLAEIVLTTDEDWISRTDRGFRIFAAKASWADDRLAAWEAEQAKKAAR